MAKFFVILVAILVILNAMTFLVVVSHQPAEKVTADQEKPTSKRSSGAASPTDLRLRQVESLMRDVNKKLGDVSRKVDSLGRQVSQVANQTRGLAATAGSAKATTVPTRRTISPVTANRQTDRQGSRQGSRQYQYSQLGDGSDLPEQGDGDEDLTREASAGDDAEMEQGEEEALDDDVPGQGEEFDDDAGETEREN